jgi:NCK-associated protein 1
MVCLVYKNLQTLNIHSELDNLYTNFPSKKDNVPIPKNLKVKNVLKELAKVAVQTIGVRHQERRSYVHAELKNVKHILAAVPGLVGPKFPIVMAAAAMAKSEILHYFRHLNADTRKDVKKYQNTDHYKCRDITVLVQDLYEVTCFVEKYREVVQMYYAEYLTAIDEAELQPIIEGVSSALPDNLHDLLPQLLGSFCRDLSDVDLEQVSDASFEGVRINWERYSTLLGITGKFNKEANDGFCKKMMEVVERSSYVDTIPALFKKYFMPYELWWYQNKVVEALKESLEYNQQPFCVFGMLSVVPMNIHPDCPEEGVLLGDSAWRFCDYLVSTMNKYVDSLLKWLWDYFYLLEKKTRAADAGNRLEKQFNARKEQKSVNAENYPGYESEGWAKKSLAVLAHNRRGVMGILEAAHRQGPLMIFDREYNVEVAVRQNISAYFETRVRSKVMSKGEMERPSIVLAEIAVGCKVVQNCFDFINADMPKILRHVLFRNFCDTSVLPPGAPPVLRQAPPQDSDGEERGVIWKIAQWFCLLVNQASAPESGLMWIPSTSSFARAKTSLRPIDVYINREEMAALCAFVGVQGVRCIDSMLLSIIADKVSQ